MRTFTLKVSIVAVAAAFPVGGAAQVVDTLGVPDTLRFAQLDVAPGRRAVLPIVVVNDQPIVGMTIPVAYPPGALRLDSAVFEGGRAARLDLLTQTADAASGRLLLGALDLSAKPMPAGQGPVAWLHFTVDGALSPGQLFTLDTGYFNEPGRLLFIAASASGPSSYLPVVVPGGVQVVEPNRPPRFLPLSDPTVREGKTLNLQVMAVDPDGGPVRMSLLNRPAGAVFIDRGNGEGAFQWTPPFTGPYSATHSPLALRFSADDGEDATIHEVQVHVVNVNRAPVLALPDTLLVSAFDTLHWNVQATDPDLEPVTLSVSGLPEVALISPGNPMNIRWRPVLADTGSHRVTVRAVDPNGGTAQAATWVRVLAVSRLELRIDTVSGFNDQSVVLQLHMTNRETIAGLELLFHLDPTAVTIERIDRVGTRLANWEMFAVAENYRGRAGDIQIIGRADINDGTPTPFLEAGSGPIVNIHLHLVANESFAGLSFPVRFLFTTSSANTALDALGQFILQSDIAYVHGAVHILKFTNKRPGDINLNGLAFEIGDVVYFANYFSNPSVYPLSFEQRANSDVNGDGTPATIADLVFLINVILGGGPVRQGESGSARAAASAVWYLDGDGRLRLEGAGPLGGVHVVVWSAGLQEPQPGPALRDMTVLSGQDGARFRMVAYSMTGARIDPAAGALLEGLSGAKIEQFQLADPDGKLLQVGAGVPEDAGLQLIGNYPNPFNPSTAIRFVLVHPGRVEADIYNLLGARVQSLAGDFDVGSHELIWRGTDHSGRPLGSGVYYYRVTAGSQSLVRRMVLLK